MDSSLDVFRGIVAAAGAGGKPVALSLVPVADGFELRFGENVLVTARGGRRVFKTTDAAYTFVRERVASSRSPQISLVLEVSAAGQLF